MAKILVVDDEADMRMALINTLEMAGYQVVDAGSGKAAFERLAAEPVDLMLLDIRLPDMDGVQILQRIQKEHPGLPVIMVTGFGSLETAVKTVQMGASDYVAKPFENKDLFQRIEKALGKKRMGGRSGPITQRLMSDMGVRQASVSGAIEVGPDYLQPLPEKKRWPWIAAAAAVVLLGAGSAVYWWFFTGETALGIPTSHLSGISYDGELFWLSDWFSQTVYECREEGRQLVVDRSHHMGEVRPTGLAWSGDALYVADSWSRKLSKHALDMSLSELSGVPSPGQAPGGLFWDGRRLWSTDQDSDEVMRHAPTADLAVQKRFHTHGTAPVALTVDDVYVWVADADTRRIYQYRIDQDLTLTAVYTHPLLRESTNALSTFLKLGDEMWFGFEGSNKVHRIKMRRLKKIEK